MGDLWGGLFQGFCRDPAVSTQHYLARFQDCCIAIFLGTFTAQSCEQSCRYVKLCMLVDFAGSRWCTNAAFDAAVVYAFRVDVMLP